MFRMPGGPGGMGGSFDEGNRGPQGGMFRRAADSVRMRIHKFLSGSDEKNPG